MSVRLKGLLRYTGFIAPFHKEYKQVHLGSSELTKSINYQSDCYCGRVNAQLPADKQLDSKINMPNAVPEYNRHVLLLSPKRDKDYEPTWKHSWESKLELNHKWPYNSISTLKGHLKKSRTKSGILVNAAYITSGNFVAPDENDKKLHFYVVPDMKLFKIQEDQLLAFAQFLTGESRSKKSASLSFADYLEGADNAHVPPIDHSDPSHQQELTLEYKEIIKDLILICGHYQRDPRCGIVGEDLIKEFESQQLCNGSNIGLVSHIGGHKYAGNMIIYRHAGFTENDHRSQVDALWFGKVVPPNLKVILDNLEQSKIAADFYRGGLQFN